MIPGNILANRSTCEDAIARTAKVGGETMKALLKTFSLKELKVIKKYPELVSRIAEIAKYTKIQLKTHLAEKYNINSVQSTGDVWIEAEGLEDLEPEWLVGGKDCRYKGILPMSGWYLSYSEPENAFEPWARNLLLQEVRENLWFRWMEHKTKSTSSSKKSKSSEELAEDWEYYVGSGGQFL